MASSQPSVSISDHDIPQLPSAGEQEKTSPATEIFLAPPRASLSVPTPVKSSIGINNPAQGGLFPLPNSQQVAGNKRNKIALGKGCSLMDWIRLTKSGKDLTGVGGPRVGGKVREVTRQELRKHRKKQDAWMAINGAVYNVTHYMDYHPGGWDELVRGAGRDATDMFNEIHKWVNYQGLLEACLVGKLVDDPPPPVFVAAPSLAPPGDSLHTQYNTTNNIKASPNSVSYKQKLSRMFTGMCSVLPPIPSKPPPPSMDYFQTEWKLTINIYTKRKGIAKENIIIDNTQENIRIVFYLPDKEAFVFNMQLHMKVEVSSALRIGSSSGKVEIDLVKCVPSRWQGLGNPLEHHLWFGSVQDLALTYHDWTVASITPITHDTKHIELSPPQGTVFSVPTGHHVHIRGVVEGMEISRSYTPVSLFHSTTTLAPTSLHFLIKIYPDGALTPQLGQLSPGSQVCVSDHTGSFSHTKLSSCQTIYLLAAGTGCTPIFSLLYKLSQRKTQVPTKLLFFNKTQADIIWQKQLADFQACQPWLSVVHVLSKEGEGDRGRVRKELLQQHFQEGKEGCFAAICGPKGFTTESNRLLRDEFLFTDDQVYLFQG